jgi:uncharacterized membrane protein (DUF4010 family)
VIDSSKQFEQCFFAGNRERERERERENTFGTWICLKFALHCAAFLFFGAPLDTIFTTSIILAASVSDLYNTHGSRIALVVRAERLGYRFPFSFLFSFSLLSFAVAALSAWVG